MPIIVTDGISKSDVVKQIGGVPTEFTQDKVVYRTPATAFTLKAGTVMAKYTGGANVGKWTVFVQGGTDGAGVAAGVFVGTGRLGDFEDVQVLASGAVAFNDEYNINSDAPILVLVNGPVQIGTTYLTWDASVNTQAFKDAALATLEAKLIKAAPQVAAITF